MADELESPGDWGIRNAEIRRDHTRRELRQKVADLGQELAERDAEIGRLRTENQRLRAQVGKLSNPPRGDPLEWPTVE